MLRRSLALLAAATLPLAPLASRGAGRGGDGPPPRVRFIEMDPGRPPEPTATAVFAGGCFWGVEEVFEHIRGVGDVVSGFAAAAGAPPAEAVRISYDPSRVTYDELLAVFFLVAHDPTQLDRQGPDVGPEYRSVVFYADSAQRQAAAAYVAELERAKTYDGPVVTQLVPLGAFRVAPAAHQDYAARHPNQPYVFLIDRPKVERLRQAFPDLYRERAASR